MTPEQVHQFIAQGDSLAREFKGEEKGQISDMELVDAVVCVANPPGQRARVDPGGRGG